MTLTYGSLFSGAERPPVTVADLRRMMGLPPAEETP